MAVHFGVFVPRGWKMDLVELDDPAEQFEAMARLARAADAEPNWRSIWLDDHFHTVPEPTLETIFEGWTATAALARDTKRVRFGQMVGCNGYRTPARYAKIASTVDAASNGRLDAGCPLGDRRGLVRARVARPRLRPRTAAPLRPGGHPAPPRAGRLP